MCYNKKVSRGKNHYLKQSPKITSSAFSSEKMRINHRSRRFFKVQGKKHSMLNQNLTLEILITTDNVINTDLMTEKLKRKKKMGVMTKEDYNL